MMKRTIRWIIIPTAAALGLAWSYSGRAQEPSTGQKVGEKFDQAVQGVKSGLKKAGDSAKEEFGKAKTAVNNMSVESRVYGRIHWDKMLNDASIDLSVSEDGVITLDGTVAAAKAKVHAVELARETVGVTKVIDRLAVRPATTTSP
jgi:hyperosmotically inducible protein